MTLTTRTVATGPDRPDLFEVEFGNELLSVKLLSLGATLWDVRPTSADPSQPGLCLALPRAEDYFGNDSYLGVTAGPVANRIRGARFELDGRRYDLEPNEGPNQLHGGPTGFSHKPWDAETVVDDDGVTREVRFMLHRPDGEGGYPGNLDVMVGYRLEGSRLRYRWTASADAPTPVSSHQPRLLESVRVTDHRRSSAVRSVTPTRPTRRGLDSDGRHRRRRGLTVRPPGRHRRRRRDRRDRWSRNRPVLRPR